jgi:hypothetical protein
MTLEELRKQLREARPLLRITDRNSKGEVTGFACRVESGRRVIRLTSTATLGRYDVKRVASSLALGREIISPFAGTLSELLSIIDGESVIVEHNGVNNQRLPVSTLNRVTPEHIWAAIHQLKDNALDGIGLPFGPSTDYDLVSDEDQRFPPKAVFGVALSLALAGTAIVPKHFSGGESSPCFRLLRLAGYQVIPKSAVPKSDEGAELEVSEGWSEGKAKLVVHIKRERALGLAKAKKAQYRRLYGKLECEECKMDPVEVYGTDLAEACIEVHHAVTQVSDMGAGHKTKLEDLQCLCANCHRLVHRKSREKEIVGL